MFTIIEDDGVSPVGTSSWYNPSPPLRHKFVVLVLHPQAHPHTQPPTQTPLAQQYTHYHAPIPVDPRTRTSLSVGSSFLAPYTSLNSYAPGSVSGFVTLTYAT